MITWILKHLTLKLFNDSQKVLYPYISTYTKDITALHDSIYLMFCIWLPTKKLVQSTLYDLYLVWLVPSWLGTLCDLYQPGCVPCVTCTIIVAYLVWLVPTWLHTLCDLYQYGCVPCVTCTWSWWRGGGRVAAPRHCGTQTCWGTRRSGMTGWWTKDSVASSGRNYCCTNSGSHLTAAGAENTHGVRIGLSI